MKKEKLWSECSKEEHQEIRIWNKQRKEIRQSYERGDITYRQLIVRLSKHEKKLDEIEQKYS